MSFLSDAESTDPRDQKTYYFRPTLFRRILVPVLKLIFKTFSYIEASGVENLPRKGGVVLAANHVTNFDVFVMQFVLPRPIFFMGKEELFRNPVLDWALRKLGGFPVHRGAQDRWAMRHAEKILQRGRLFGIFPEGKRSKGKGLHPGKTGGARLAKSVECPVVPLAIYGTQHLFRRFPRRTRIVIHVGKPIHPRPDESPMEMTERVMFAIADMLPPEARGIYAQRPPGFRS